MTTKNKMGSNQLTAQVNETLTWCNPLDKTYEYQTDKNKRLLQELLYHLTKHKRSLKQFDAIVLPSALYISFNYFFNAIINISFTNNYFIVIEDTRTGHKETLMDIKMDLIMDMLKERQS